MTSSLSPASAQIAHQLLDLGLRPGGVLLVHSSLRALGRLEGGPESVVQGLLSALGPKGTLLMPALSYASVTPAQPFFDARSTPSCVGALPEYFRTRPASLRSIHPTHSICGLGPLASELLEGHELDHTPCGPHSPFSRLPLYQGQVLFLGCGLRPNTSMHAVEEQVNPPYLFGPPLEYTLRFADGHEKKITALNHNFQGWEQRYDRLAGLLAAPALTAGPVLAAACHLLDAPALWSAALAALRADPLFFVEPSP